MLRPHATVWEHLTQCQDSDEEDPEGDPESTRNPEAVEGEEWEGRNKGVVDLGHRGD